MRSIFIFLLLLMCCYSAEWDANNFPNPTAGQFKQCNMRTTANICDPDGVLSEAARYRLDHDLKQLEQRTRQDYGRTFCDKKGVTAAMAVARHVRGGSTEAVEQMANDMLHKWTLDSQCQKAVVIVVSTDDMKFWVARDDRVPVYAEEFTQIFMQQKGLFQQGNYQQALTNILQSTWDKAISKAGQPRQPSGTGGGGARPPTFGGESDRGSGGKEGGSVASKIPSIPSWFWLLLFAVIIPLLCCACCCYCCCCRGKSGANQPVPQNTDGGMGGGVAPPSGGGSRFGGFLSNLGGAGIGSMVGNLIANRGRGGGGGGGGGGGFRGGQPGYQGGGAYPAEPTPVYDDNQGQGGGGLYPSVAVKDRGGGGSWA